MSPLFETIKVSNGRLLNISYHNERMNRSRRELFDSEKTLNLADTIQIPNDLSGNVHKCKVIYEKDIQKIEWTRYTYKKLERIRLVTCDEIDYSYKYLDRSIFEILLLQNKCSETEDILIVKNNRITDTTFSNVILFDGNEWHTPKFPLLKGTKRAKLIEEKKVIEKEILLDDLKNYEKIILINAMLEIHHAKAELVKDFIVK
jgi:4-amino-4-deoxychorismate lyase